MEKSSNSSGFGDIDIGMSIDSYTLKDRNPIMKSFLTNEKKGTIHLVSATSRSIQNKIEKSGPLAGNKVPEDSTQPPERIASSMNLSRTNQTMMDLNMSIPDQGFDLNPVVAKEPESESTKSEQQKKLMLPQFLVSQMPPKQTTTCAKLTKRLSLDVTWSSREEIMDFFSYYELKLSAVYLMHSLAKQTEILYESPEDQPKKQALDYLLMLKGILMLLDIENQRKKAKMQLEEKDQAVNDCKKLIHFMFQEVYAERKKIQEGILKASGEPCFQAFAKKLLDNPQKTYSVFTQHEIQEAYEKILGASYDYNYRVFKTMSTQHHFRLNLWLVLCLHVDSIFFPESFSRCFDTYFIYKTEKLRRNFLPGDEIERYIISADEETICNHHNRLRKEFKHVSARAINSNAQ